MLLCDTDKVLSLLKSVSIDPAMLTCTVLLASLLALCCCFMKLLSGKVLQYQQIPNLQNHEVNVSDALAMPKRYPRDTPFSFPDTQVHVSL